MGKLQNIKTLETLYIFYLSYFLSGYRHWDPGKWTDFTKMAALEIDAWRIKKSMNFRNKMDRKYSLLLS